MRIHGDNILTGDIYDAAKAARVTVVRAGLHNSRTRDHAFDIALRGESRRRPMGGGDDYAATWDQWGVFLAVLFAKDDTLTIPRVYEDASDFNFHTCLRFSQIGGGWPVAFPVDYHGDHTFRYSGTPHIHFCTKCTAKQRTK